MPPVDPLGPRGIKMFQPSNDSTSGFLKAAEFLRRIPKLNGEASKANSRLTSPKRGRLMSAPFWVSLKPGSTIGRSSQKAMGQGEMQQTCPMFVSWLVAG